MYLNCVDGDADSIQVFPGRELKLGRSNVSKVGDNNEAIKVSRHVCTVFGLKDANATGEAEVVAEKGKLYILPSGKTQWKILQAGKGHKEKVRKF
jgi:hypothetical protein